MNILFLSGREVEYPRNRVILKILRKHHNVKVCTTRHKNYLLRLFTTFCVFFYYNLFFKKDLVFVGFFGQPFMPFVRFLTGKKIVFDAFISAYDTLVFNRDSVKAGGMGAKLLFWLDKVSCNFADRVMLDTYEHINFFVKTFGVDRRKFRRLFVGAKEDIFLPSKRVKKDDSFVVEFHGLFATLSGVEHVIDAAKLLEKEDMKFVLIGDGPTFDECKALVGNLGLKNVVLKGRRPVTEIPKYLSECDVGLGVFGTTDKAMRVIPNKAYEIIATGTPLVTEDSPAARELFSDGQNVLFCKPADAKDLARVLLDAKKNKSKVNKVGEAGLVLFNEKCSVVALDKVLSDIIMMR